MKSIARKTKGRPDATDVAIGRRIRERRTELKLSQEMLAPMLGVTYQQLQKYETGVNRVSGSKIRRLARALLVRPGYFFGEKEDPDGVEALSARYILAIDEGAVVVSCLRDSLEPILRDLKSIREDIFRGRVE